MRCLF